MFDNNNILLLFPIVFLYFTYRYWSNKMYWPMSLFYAIGGLFGFLLTQQEYFVFSINFGHQEISIAATLYLIFCCSILFEPIRKNKIDYNFLGVVNFSNLKICINIFIFVSLLYSIAVYPYMDIAASAADAMAYHDEIIEDGGLDISNNNPILEKLFSFQEMLRPIFTFFFCYILSDTRFSIKYKVLFGACCIFPTLMSSFASSHRNIAIFALIDFLLCFYLFYQRYSKNIRKSVIVVCSIFGVAVLIIVLFFALVRFTDTTGGDLAAYSLYRYAGEPVVNFNTMLWNTNDYLYGNKCFTTIREFLNFDVVSSGSQREYYYNLDYVIYCFYTSVGNFYMDFGFWGGIVLSAIIAYLFHIIINKKFTVNTITRFLTLLSRLEIIFAKKARI